MEYAIAQQSLFSRTESHIASGWTAHWLDLADDKLVGIRLRWALSEQDWAAVEQQLAVVV